MADLERTEGYDRFSTLRRRFAEGAIGSDDIEWLCDLVDSADEFHDACSDYGRSGDRGALGEAMDHYHDVRRRRG